MEKSKKDSILPPLWVLVAALLALVLWLISQLQEIVILLVIAFSISYLIEPLLRKLEKHEIRRPIGFFAIAGIALIILMLIAVMILPVLQREFYQLLENLPIYLEAVQNKCDPFINKIKSFFADSEDISLESFSVGKIAQNLLPKISSGLTSTLLQGYSLTLTLVNLALLPFLIFYVSMGFPNYRLTFLKYFPNNIREKTSSIISEIDGFVSSFVRGQLIVSTVLFVLYAIGLSIVGVELWFLLALIAGYGNLIPYLGTIVGVLLASLMALVTFGDWTHLLFVWLVFVVVQFLEGTFITPKILGDNVGLSPLIIILAIVIGGTLFGLLGVFLAVPGAAILKVLTKHFHIWLLARV